MSSAARKTRMGTFFALFCLAYLAVITKLCFLQLIKHSFFSELGDRQYITTITKIPDRAPIFDRHGTPLAVNRIHASACIIPKCLTTPEQTQAFLTEHFPHAAARLAAAPDASFLYVQRKLTDAQQELITNANLPDIFIMPEPGRFYPLTCAGTIIGITNIDNEGTSGLELMFNEQLRGTPTTFSLKRDARNKQRFYFERELSQQGSSGTPLTTTIDSTIQFVAHEELTKTIAEVHATAGSVIVMDPTTGEIYAMANYPDFDPNDSAGLIIDHMKNRCVTETYEFGSVIKIFLALAALAEGVVDLDTLINCYNTKAITLQGMKLTTVHPHGMLTFSEVIEGSNNIGTAQIALQLKEKIYDHYRKCGFGTSTHTFVGEQAGYVTPPRTWSRQSLASLSYGYEVRATLLQLASAVSIIANNGILVAPRILRSEIPAQRAQVYDPAVIQQVQTILERTITNGTAKRAAIKGYHVMGKTGSANLIIDGVYNPDYSIYTFAGIVSTDNYRRTIVTFIKEAQGRHRYASTVAAPLFERIAERVLIHDGQIASPTNS